MMPDIPTLRWLREEIRGFLHDCCYHSDSTFEDWLEARIAGTTTQSLSDYEVEHPQ